jgi:outer membrane protein TolC
MTTRGRIAALLVAGLALSIPAARARAAGAEARVLTLDEALAIARTRNRNLAVERARLAQAQTNLAAAWALLLPTVAAQGRYTRNYTEFNFVAPAGPILIQPVNQLDLGGSFQAPLVVPAAYSGLQSVKSGIAASEAAREANESSILLAVAQTFYAAAGADGAVAARRSSIEVAKATLASARTRFSAGTVTKVDVDRAELALVRAEQAERDAKQGRAQTYRTLATLIQLSDSEPFIVQVPEQPPPAIDAASLDLQSALKLRPEVRAYQLQLQSAEEHARSLAWRWAPSLSAFGNARKFNYDNFARDRYSWAVGVSLDWTLYDGGNRDAQRNLANAQAAEAQAQAGVVADNIRDDIANSRTLLETKQHAVNAATRSLELARETIELVRTQYEAGTVTQVDLLQAQDSVVSAQLALLQARFDVAVADVQLRHAAGTFPPK